jgi:hypothetical protein
MVLLIKIPKSIPGAYLMAKLREYSKKTPQLSEKFHLISASILHMHLSNAKPNTID